MLTQLPGVSHTKHHHIQLFCTFRIKVHYVHDAKKHRLTLRVLKASAQDPYKKKRGNPLLCIRGTQIFVKSFFSRVITHEALWTE